VVIHNPSILFVILGPSRLSGIGMHAAGDLLVLALNTVSQNFHPFPSVSGNSSPTTETFKIKFYTPVVYVRIHMSTQNYKIVFSYLEISLYMSWTQFVLSFYLFCLGRGGNNFVVCRYPAVRLVLKNSSEGY